MMYAKLIDVIVVYTLMSSRTHKVTTKRICYPEHTMSSQPPESSRTCFGISSGSHKIPKQVRDDSGGWDDSYIRDNIVYSDDYSANLPKYRVSPSDKLFN